MWIQLLDGIKAFDVGYVLYSLHVCVWARQI
jgi:hypothetical protein